MIRRARHQDLPAIIDLGSALNKRGSWRYAKIEFKPAMDRLLRGLRDPHEWIGVAEHKGQIVGFLILVAQPMWWCPSMLQVLDDIIYCERPGLGRKLLKAGVEWAESLDGVAEIIISLNAGIETERSARAIEAQGFMPRGVTLSKLLSKRKHQWVA